MKFHQRIGPCFIFGVALIVIHAAAPARAEYAADAPAGSFGFVSQKAAIKKASRWTLEDWLATKERMQWSNLWLSFNSPTPYEFFLLGAYAPEPAQWRYGAGAYAQGVGLEYDKETIFDPAWNARFHFRLMGYNVQNTNLTLHAGIRGRSNAPESYRQGYWGASLTLYLRKFFGVSGQYRSYAGSTASSLGKVTGDRIEVGPFIDFGPLRVFGNWLKETDNADDPVLGYSRQASFWSLGAQLFF